MRRRFTSLLTLALACVAGASLYAQKITDLGTGGGGSPHVRAEWTIDGAHVAVEYGRPSLKGRPEAQLMPPGQPWRTGADQATTITSDKPLTFGTLRLAANTPYTINTIPGDKGWQLVVGKLDKPGQWGIPYQPALEIGKRPMKAGRAATPVEQLTISIDDTQAGATLRIEWGSVSATAPFTVG
jgi:Protein of unknown function (DUF2911)